jgi:ankyrin repeat protein
METIKAELLEIPPEMEHFYQEILEGANENDLPQSLQLMQWLCFSGRPLTIEELRWAMVVGANCPYDSLEECKSSMDWADTDNTMENRLNYLSGGLAEVVLADLADSEYEGSDNGDGNNEKMTDDKIDSEETKYNGSNGDSSNEINNEDQSGKAHFSAPMNDGLAANPVGKQIRRVAQFIHQSVEDYLTSSRLEKLDNYAKRSVVGRGHHSLLRACIQYISMQEVLSFAKELENRQITSNKLLTLGSGTATGGNEQGQRGTSASLDNARKEKVIENKAQIEDSGGTINRHLQTDKSTLSTEPQAEQPTEDYLGLVVSDVDEDSETQLLRIATELHRDHTRVRASGGESSQMGAAREQAFAADSLLESSCQSDNQQLVAYRASNQVDIPPGCNISNEIEKSRDQDLQDQFHGDFPDTFSDADDESPFRDIPGHHPWDMERRHVVTDSDRRHRDKWTAKRDFPLLHYAVKFCLIHALLAESEGVPQGNLVELLQTPKLASKGASPHRQRRVNGVSPNRPANQIITPWKCLHNLINVVISNDKSYIPVNTTLLHIASKYALISVVEELLDPAHKNDADPKGANGWTPLFYAAQQGHDAVARLLLKSGRVDLDTIGNDACTPLSYSAACQSEGVMQMLLNTAKVEVDRKDESGRTALFWASRFGSEAAVHRLLDTGKVDVNLKDKEGNSILSWATEELYHPSFKRPGGDDRLQRKEELTAIIQLLPNSGKIDLGKDEEGQTLLSTAAKNGHDLLVQQLLKTGKFDLNSRDSTRRTPLSLAAYNGYVAVVKRLLKTGRADVNSKDDGRRTPLSLALSYLAYININILKPQGDKDEQENEIRMLLATKKLNIKRKDMDLWTSCLKSYSLERDHLAVVRLLLDTGKIHVGLEDQWVQPPSEWLAINGKEEEDLKAAQAASLARIEKEEHKKHELEAAIAASLARKEEEDQEKAALEAALSVSLLQPDDEDAIMKIIMAMSLEDTSNLPTERGSEVNDTDYDYAYYDEDVELELAKAASPADDIEKLNQATQNTTGAASHESSVPEPGVQQQVDRLSGLESKPTPVPAPSSPAPAPKPKSACLSQASTETPSKPTPQPKPEHLTRPSPKPKPKPKPKHLACTTEPGAKS